MDLYLLLLSLICVLVLSAILLRLWYLRVYSARLRDHSDRKAADNAVILTPSEHSPALPAPFNNIPRSKSFTRFNILVFCVSLIIYLVTRFIGLDQFPITFFADEAASTVIAADLINNGLRYEDELLPIYFLNVDKYSLSATVYLQILPYLLFGKSILATRGASIAFSLVGVVGITLALKQFYRLPVWWVGALLFSATPAWFMHSRTAFEAPIATSFYAIFLYGYLLYRYRSPTAFPLVLLTAGLTFYTYNPARVTIIAALSLLILSDFSYHRENFRVIRRSWWLFILLSLPFIRFQLTHPFSSLDQLHLLNAYWIQPLSLGEKLVEMATQLTRGLSPLYWFFPHDQDLIRHTMKGYGHVLWITLPFFLLGLGIAIKHVRIPAYRAALIVLVCAPLGGAIVETTVTRSLHTLGPIILLTAIGLTAFLRWFPWTYRRYLALALTLLLLLSSISLYMMLDAIENGPTWYRDYGLYGMQYGSSQVFDEINALVEATPRARVIASPYWANGTSMLARFFMDDLTPLRWGVLGEILAQDLPIREEDTFMLLPEDYAQVVASDRIDGLTITSIIRYPDGQPGFWFAQVVPVNQP